MTKKARAGSLAPLRAAREMVRTRHSAQLARTASAGVPGALRFRRGACSAPIRGMPSERGMEGGGGARVVPRSLVGDAINVIISIDCSKARCGSGGVLRLPRSGREPRTIKGADYPPG